MTNPAAGTAYGPMSIVAVEQYYPADRRVVQDSLAFLFLPFGLKVITAMSRWSPVRRMVLNLSEKRAGGVWGSVLCRKRFIDDKLLEAVHAGIQTVVNLGAGMDTRAYRSSIPSAISVFEVDLPQNIAFKRKIIREVSGEVPVNVNLVPVDFDHQDLESRLTSQGYQTGNKCFFIWEGVTQYLSEEGVRRTMRFLSKAGRGSRLAFTYIRRDFINGSVLYGLEALYGVYRGENPIWHFGLDPQEVPAFLRRFGWKELEQAGTKEYTSRYLNPAGRTIPVTEIERSVYAEKA